MSQLIEWRVRPVTRYIVTRFHQNTPDEGCAGSDVFGEFDNERSAYAVADAMSTQERVGLGWSIDDDRMKPPESLDDVE